MIKTVIILKNIRPILCLLLLLSFYGCSVPTYLYIQNLSNENKVITVTFNTELSDSSVLSLNKLDVRYVEGTFNAKKFKPRKISNLNSPDKKIRDSSMVVTLPARSTAMIIRSNNYHWLSLINSVEVDHVKISMNELRNQSEHIRFGYIYSIR
nr:hypothetical protein [uncultured Chryseobacterium sp.]